MVNSSELIMAMQNLRERIYSSNKQSQELTLELKVNNFIELNKKGIISDSALKEKLMSIPEYRNAIENSNKPSIKAKIR